MADENEFEFVDHPGVEEKSRLFIAPLFRTQLRLLEIYASDAREIFHITHDGQVIVNPEFTVDEAAAAFWDAVRKLARPKEA